MSKIYTKTGDKGKTSLFDGTRVSKDNIRLETYGTFDELNAILGMALALLDEVRSKNYELRNIRNELIRVQSELLDIGSCLANPSATPPKEFISLIGKRIEQFEKHIDVLTEKLPPLRNFILPGGGKTASMLHVARTVTRRSERRLVELAHKEPLDSNFVRYFNRLSDLLFTMARFVNTKEKGKDIIWSPFKK